MQQSQEPFCDAVKQQKKVGQKFSPQARPWLQHIWEWLHLDAGKSLVAPSDISACKYTHLSVTGIMEVVFADSWIVTLHKYCYTSIHHTRTLS